jgi:hypothetical protein
MAIFIIPNVVPTRESKQPFVTLMLSVYVFMALSNAVPMREIKVL